MERTITTERLREYLGLGRTASVHRAMRRRGLAPVARQPGRSGQDLWDERAALNSTAPGQGARASKHKQQPATQGAPMSTYIVDVGSKAPDVADWMTKTAGGRLVLVEGGAVKFGQGVFDHFSAVDPEHDGHIDANRVMWIDGTDYPVIRQ